MHVIAIDGGPLKNGNTARLLQAAIEGAEKEGATTEIVNLYELNYKGCINCFACKRKNSPVERCVVIDDLEPVLEKIYNCDALILGSPVFLSSVTGAMQSFIERLAYPFFTYDRPQTITHKKINTALIYTMNFPKFSLSVSGYNRFFKHNENILKSTFGYCESLVVRETFPMEEHEEFSFFSEELEKRLAKQEAKFAQDLKKARCLGSKFAKSKQVGKFPPVLK